jgi:hypothetical protein
MVWPSSPVGNAEDSFASFGYRYPLLLLVVVEMMNFEFRRTYLGASSHQVAVAGNL